MYNRFRSSINDYETTLSLVDPTADRTITLPNVTGTVITTANDDAIDAVGTVSSGTWQGTAVTDTYVADDLTVSGGTVNNSVIGGTTPAAGTFTTITGTSLSVTSTSGITLENDETITNSTDGTVSIGGSLSGTGTISGFDANLSDQTGTTYTLAAADNGKVVTLNNASAITVTIPTSLGDGFNCLLVQKGDGQVTIAAASNVVLYNRSSESKTAG